MPQVTYLTGKNLFQSDNVMLKWRNVGLKESDMDIQESFGNLIDEWLDFEFNHLQ